MIKSKKLVEEYKKTVGKYTYEQRDCITSITEILLAHGGKHDLNGSNFYARNEIKNLRPLTDKSQLYDGCAVLKTILPGESGYNLPPRYKNHIDQIDYNHIGVGTSKGEIYDSTRTADGRDGPGLSTAPINSRSWDRIGDFEDVDYSDQGTNESQEPTSEQPSTIGSYMVTAPSGDTVNLRAQMNTTSVIYEYVKIGSIVEVLQRYSSWSKVRTAAGKIGYIMNKFLSPVGDSPSEAVPEENQNESQPALTTEQKVEILWNQYISGGEG